ncbi:MAG: Sua5/YciO/YrdC/YwlC family protein [Phycisphaeraceae bacterium]|nr:MAG: Sua5/YciO/YrdC/YwlC family protein [Phycisphaeraceae bacterium]
MQTGAVPWKELDEAERRNTARAAGAVLRDGGLVITPTETVYGVMAHAGSAAAVENLRRHAGPGRPDAPRFTWHAPDTDAVRDTIPLPTAVHRRLVDRLLPGPIRFIIELDETAVAAVLKALKIGPGVIDDGARVSVRVSPHEIAREVIEWAAVPIIAERLGATHWGDPSHPDHAVGDTSDFLGTVIDAGELRTPGPSATIRLKPNGAFEVDPAGWIDEKDVMEALRKRILFVCTGNTCRSPMAEALARSMVAARREDGVEIIFESAGAATGDGMPASPEAVRVVQAMGGDLRAHRSRRLTAAMIDRAEHVYVMTRGHRARVLELSPGADSKVELLDPTGDVPDPIGGPEEVYRETADRLRRAIAARFEERGL